MAYHKPRVGILSIGEEEVKGNDLTKEAFKLLQNSPLNFIGNVEGRDMFTGQADVIVCDGFTGNVALKVSEGVFEFMMRLLKHELKATIQTKAGRIAYATGISEIQKATRLCRIRRRAASGDQRRRRHLSRTINAKAIRNAISRGARLLHGRCQRKIEEHLVGAAVDGQPRRTSRSSCKSVVIFMEIMNH